MSNATQDFTINALSTGFFRFNTVSQTWNVATGRTLTINGNWSTQGNSKSLTLTGAGNVVINSNVNAGSNPLGLIITGANVTLTGTNSWSNNASTSFRMDSGTLNFGNDNAIASSTGSNSFQLNGGTLTAAGGARNVTTTAGFYLGGDFAIGDNAAGAQALTLGSALTVAGGYADDHQ